MDRELLLLKLRNAIANKEWATACANMQTASAGAWTCDWYAGIREAERELEEVMRQLAGPALRDGLCKVWVFNEEKGHDVSDLYEGANGEVG